MKRLHILGRKNHGKTTLIVDLIPALVGRGLRVATIKHTHHRHELDTPGKDSHRHRQAGAACVGILSPGLSAAYWVAADDASEEDRYAAFAHWQSTCDLVLVEGDTRTTAAKIEVWREEAGGPPLSAADAQILALISNDPVESSCLRLRRTPLDDLVDWIVNQAASP